MIETLRGRFGVEPVARMLGVSTSTYYARRGRPASARAVRDEEVLDQICRIRVGHAACYGARRTWLAPRRAGVQVARCTVERLMREHGLVGVRRGRRARTTVADTGAARPPDLVERNFTAARPDQLWLADLTYVPTWQGFCYVAFVLDAFSRRIVGWQTAGHLRTDLPLDAPEMALWNRRVHSGQTIHHSDAGSQADSTGRRNTLTVRSCDGNTATTSVGVGGAAGDAFAWASAGGAAGASAAVLGSDRLWTVK